MGLTSLCLFLRHRPKELPTATWNRATPDGNFIGFSCEFNIIGIHRLRLEEADTRGDPARFNNVPGNFSLVLSAADPLLATENYIAEANNRANKYEWTKAAENYRLASDHLNRGKDPRRAADLSELLAESYSKAAFQSQTRRGFRDLMNLSEQAHRAANELFETAGSEPLAKKAKARALFAKFWIVDQPDEKRTLLDQCMNLAQESARFFEDQGDNAHRFEALRDLLAYREQALHFSKERKILLDIFESAVENAWMIIFEEVMIDKQTALEAADTLVQLYLAADYVLEQPRYEELERRLAKLKDRITQLRVNAGTTSGDALAHEACMGLAEDLEQDIPKTLEFFEKALSSAQAMGDRYMIGRLNTLAAAVVRWVGVSEEYAEKRREQLEKAIVLAESGIDHLQGSSPSYWIKRAYGVKIDASNALALTVETDIDKKRSMLRQAIETTRQAMKYEQLSFMTGVGHQLSRSMYLLATMEAGPEEKKHLLMEALPIREAIVRTFEQLSPHSWSRGMVLNYLALIKAELSKVEKDPAKMSELIKSASIDMELCVKLCGTLAGISQAIPGKVRMLAQFIEWHGDIQQQLYNTTLDPFANREAIDSYNQSIAYLSKLGNIAGIPPIRWKVAQTHDSVGEYREASQSFHSAADEYRLAGKKNPILAATFEELAQYMEAWDLIEDARSKHEQDLYGTAAEDYTKAASKLRTTKTWSHLSKHYTACSFLELGEALSYRERQQAAIESFTAAQGTFQEAKDDLESQLDTTSEPREKKELNDWLEITKARLRYSSGRAQLEDARVLDIRGEVESSCTNYRKASETFGFLLSETSHGRTRKEMEALKMMCDAWATMKTAESKASPELYAEAADSFTKVERLALGHKFQLTALASASMCKALESGSLFRRTRDKELYADIKKRLQTAAEFYEEAGIAKAADWTKATQRFFDALTYLNEAEVEHDPRKKTESYHLAERHLGQAVKLYGDSGYSKKKEEAASLLKRVRDEEQIFLAPVSALGGNTILTSTTPSPVSFTGDQAIGLERFEAANLVGNATLDHDVVGVGSDLVLELEMANIGKTAATLLKVENVQQEGLELIGGRIEERIEDGHIDMRGRRIDYLKTHELKLTIKARNRGSYQLRPRVLYVDEKGVYRSFVFEAPRIIVRELAGEPFMETERRLSAIMFTDIVGYTSLTEENEALALELLEEHRRLLRPLFPRYSGKEVKTVGDMFIVEFTSALEAVRCAIRLQQTLSRRDLERSPDRRLRVRIGIHMGDVEHTRGDIYGDAVNIASRIEPLAEPGGIVVTSQVYDQIRSRPDIKIQSLGSRELKNVKGPIEVFSITP